MMDMKTRIINIMASLVLLFLMMGCSEMDSLMGERSEKRISLTMQMPTDEKTRVSLTEASDTKDLIARWQEDDEVQVFIRQDDNVYEGGKVKVTSISQDGKSAALNLDLPGMINQTKPFVIYCFTGIDGQVRDVDNGIWYPYCRMNVTRSLKTKFKAPMFAQIDVPSAFSDGDFNGGAGGGGSSWENGGSSQDGAGGGGGGSWGVPNFTARFKHIGTYEVLHLKNTSTKKVSVVHCGFETKLPWYQDYAGVDLVDSYDYTKLPSEWDGDNESPALEIPAGTEGVFLSSYMPSGFKVEDAQLVTRIDGSVVKSLNKKSSNVTIQRRHAYHMYATWDGKELKFEDGEITLQEGKHILISPNSVEFGQVAVGLSKATQFSVRNIGTERVKFTIHETHGEIDIYDSGKEFILASGEEKTLVASYRPTSINNGFNIRTYIDTDAEEGKQYIDFSGSAIAPNYNSEELIFNGDFSLGAVGFTSDYVYVSEKGSRTLWDEGKYAVGTCPRDYHFDFRNNGDHTTGTGNMLIVNGSTDNKKYAWKQSVYVEKGKTYEFSAWFISVSGHGSAQKDDIEYNINGIANLGNYDKTENGWDRYYWRYTATETGQIMLKIRTMSAAAGGNDFAIDDISFTRKSSNVAYLSCPDDHHPHMIDLGLPSGTLWACCNVGADKPEGYGGYYAWGETEEKSVYNQASVVNDLITCNNEDMDIAGTNYDAARVNWGAPWQMPTLDKFKELQNNTSSVWTTRNGVNGINITGTNGGSIFFPASGYKKDEESRSIGRWGAYWVSLIDWWILGQCVVFHFTPSVELGQSIHFGYDGLPIRPVVSPNGKPDYQDGGNPSDGDGRPDTPGPDADDQGDL